MAATTEELVNAISALREEVRSMKELQQQQQQTHDQELKVMRDKTYEEARQVLEGKFQAEFATWRDNQLAQTVASAAAAEVQKVSPTKEFKDFGLTTRRAFQYLPKYNGSAEKYEEWNFKLKTFFTEEPGWAEILEKIEELPIFPALNDIEAMFSKLNAERKLISKPEISMSWMNHQLYQVLSLNVTDKALAAIKNLFGEHDVNGLKGWWKLHNECSTMTVQRVQGLASKIYNPRRCKKFSEVTAAIDDWELTCQIFKKVEPAGISETAKTFGICQIVPEELYKEIRSSISLDSYEKIKAYVTQQVSVRRDHLHQSGPTPMELDNITEARKLIANIQSGGEDQWDHQWDSGQCDYPGQCEQKSESEPECEKDKVIAELMSFVKGKGKGGGGYKGGGGWYGKGKGGKGKGERFEGNCSHCGLYGHKMIHCRKKDEEMNAYRAQKGKGGKSDGKGYGGGKGYGNGGKGYQGYNNKGKGKGGGYNLNIWEISQQIGNQQQPQDGGQQWDQQPWENAKKPWSLYRCEKAVPGIGAPPGLRAAPCGNQWQSLSREDTEADEDVVEQLKELCEKQYSEIDGKATTKKEKRMPRMGNYSKGQLKKSHLNCFQQ